MDTFPLRRSVGFSFSQVLTARWTENELLLFGRDIGTTTTTSTLLVFCFLLPAARTLTLEITAMLTKLEDLWFGKVFCWAAVGVGALGNDNWLVKLFLTTQTC